MNFNYIPIAHSDGKAHITTIYKFKNKCKNNINYISRKGNSCKGRGKIDKKQKIFIITHQCDQKVTHQI